MKIRQANKDDYDNIQELVKGAFHTAQMPYENEDVFVLDLRTRDSFIPELELIAEENGELVGHIILTKQIVKTKDEEYAGGLLLAPLCVKLEYRNKGIGAELTYAGLEKAKELGFTSVFLVGYPKYYTKFGFKEIGEFRIENKTGIENKFVLGYELIEGCLSDVGGMIDHME